MAKAAQTIQDYSIPATLQGRKFSTLQKRKPNFNDFLYKTKRSDIEQALKGRWQRRYTYAIGSLSSGRVILISIN